MGPRRGSAAGRGGASRVRRARGAARRACPGRPSAEELQARLPFRGQPRQDAPWLAPGPLSGSAPVTRRFALRGSCALGKGEICGGQGLALNCRKGSKVYSDFSLSSLSLFFFDCLMFV